jgi:hypothetical protein
LSLFFPNFIPLVLQPLFAHKKDRLFQSHCCTHTSDLNSVFFFILCCFSCLAHLFRHENGGSRFFWHAGTYLLESDPRTPQV